MALIHQATLAPSKLELVAAWLPGRPWFADEPDLKQVGAYRFDDPAGAVGIETLLVRTPGGPVLQVPLTYRAAPVAAADAYLLGTTEHSVLGRRWVYDGCGDPVWAAALAAAVLTGGTEAEELVADGDRRQARPPTATIRGSGAPGTPVPAITTVTSQDEGATTVVRAGAVSLVVARVVGVAVDAEHALTGRWAGSEPIVLAGVRVRR